MGNYEMKPTLPVPALAPPARPQGSRESSPRYEDALEAPLPDVPVKRADNLADVDIAANVPLPPGTDSPLKGRSVSPEPVSETSRAASEMSESKSTVSNCMHSFVLGHVFVDSYANYVQTSASRCALKFSIGNHL